MDFIERTFGVAPDGGTGSLEVLLAALLVALCAAVVRARYRDMQRASTRRPPDARRSRVGLRA